MDTFTTDRIKEFFDSRYQLNTEACSSAKVGFVFGRYDVELASVMSRLWRAHKVERFFISGGTGKDSGPLAILKIPEAHFVASHALSQGIHPSTMELDTLATNGAENSRHMLDWVQRQGLITCNVICVGHPISLLRLFAVQLYIQTTEFPELNIYYQLMPTTWPCTIDEISLMNECRRLRDWPDKNWAHRLTIPPNILAVI